MVSALSDRFQFAYLRLSPTIIIYVAVPTSSVTLRRVPPTIQVYPGPVSNITCTSADSCYWIVVFVFANSKAGPVELNEHVCSSQDAGEWTRQFFAGPLVSSNTELPQLWHISKPTCYFIQLHLAFCKHAGWCTGWGREGQSELCSRGCQSSRQESSQETRPHSRQETVGQQTQRQLGECPRCQGTNCKAQEATSSAGNSQQEKVQIRHQCRRSSCANPARSESNYRFSSPRRNLFQHQCASCRRALPKRKK